MNLANRWAELIYRLATTKSRLKIILTPIGVTFWLSLLVVLVLASIWLDRILPIHISIPSPTNLILGILLLLIGLSLSGWPILSFIRARGSPVPINPPKSLVVKGLYAYIRNPMVLGNIVILFGVGILLSSFSLIFIFAPLFILLNFFYLKTIEEREMEKKFGQEYLEYKKEVPMFLPRFGKRRYFK